MLDINGFATGYEQLMTDMQTKETNSNHEFATRFAALLNTLFLSADVKIGITVTTTGSATAQTGATTSIGKLQ